VRISRIEAWGVLLGWLGGLPQLMPLVHVVGMEEIVPVCVIDVNDYWSIIAIELLAGTQTIHTSHV